MKNMEKQTDKKPFSSFFLVLIAVKDYYCLYFSLALAGKMAKSHYNFNHSKRRFSLRMKTDISVPIQKEGEKTSSMTEQREYLASPKSP